MGPVTIKRTTTFVAGRPSSGKTRTAVETCRQLLHHGWNIIYYHAEGSHDAEVSAYGVQEPEHLLQFRLVTDLNFSLDALVDELGKFYESRNPAGHLVVIDTLELFDALPEHLFSLIQNIQQTQPVHFLILSQLPRSASKRTKDHAEQYVRKTYQPETDYEIIVLGSFAND